MLHWLTRNRRAFLRSSLVAAVSGLLSLRPLRAARRNRKASAARDVLAELQARRFLNAAGTYTRLTASKMPREVLDAMQVASGHYVDLVDLHGKAGDRIAELLECEAAVVTAGCASALTLATAACVAGTDEGRIRRLPDTAGMKDEVILQTAHRNGYDHAIRNCGVHLVEVDTAAELEAAIGERTAMLFFLNSAENKGQVGHEEFVRIGRRHGVATLNDAAADVPPVENLFRFTRMGYDLVAFSGGKGLLGPQSAGLLLGRRDLIEAARLNNNPHSDSVGRSNKVNKEEIVGMLVALELFLERDHDRMWKEWNRACNSIQRAVGSLRGVSTEIFVPPIANAVPHVRIRWDQESFGLDAAGAAARLREGEPGIEVRPRYEDGLEVAVWMLDPGDERIVGRRIREVLAASRRATRRS